MSDNVIRRDVIQLELESEALKEIQKLKKELDELKKKLGVTDDDNFKKTKDSAKKARKEIDETTKSTGKLGSALKKVAKVSFKALAVGIGAGATAVGALVGKSVSAYADLEQLRGGVETLFGAQGAKSAEEYAKLTGKSVADVKDKYGDLVKAQKTVFSNANDAFKTAGLSANDYMTTITSFSAALTKSLGGDTLKAAELSDMAIKDMADNANKYGTAIEDVQVVYSGLARGLYQTLDNLKLGYAGTKEGAKDLVNDAAQIDKSIKKNDLSLCKPCKSYSCSTRSNGHYRNHAERG